MVGTAGHIDHGKSALVRALTGTDPDRLKEEKERGITIDLGFAHCELGDGVVASFVDVPGHERFVRHMLAGAHGIDAVALVVAADESVMPQTREHFHICRLLGVPRGLVVLTKCDAADADSQAIAELEARELAAGSFLETAPIVRVSARTGDGLPALREALLALARESPPRPSDGLLRLPVDRVFSMKGFGVVVTGTLVAGELATGEEVEALPSGRRARVRGLQVHGETVERAAAGTRTAVNLAGEVEGLARGEVLARPGTLRATSMIDAQLSLLPGARPLADGARVRVHAASAEVLARVRLLGAQTLEPGQSALAQLRLESPAVTGRGDRLVLRSYSPADTIAGAVVVDPLPPRRRTADRPAVERLRDAVGLLGAAEAMVAEAGPGGIDAPLLAARLTVPLARLTEEIPASGSMVALGQDPAVVVSRAALGRLGERALEVLEVFHRSNPLKAAMPREDLRGRAFDDAPVIAFERVLADLAAAGRVKLLPDAVAAARHEVRLSAGEEEARQLILETAQAAGLSGVELPALAERSKRDVKLLERVARVLGAERVLGRVGEGLLVHRDHLEALKLQVRERWPAGS
ncbi:MAG TPA: selenocysteine-specific translation elongation factor, partial [Vicinamibacteria bacterium]|nr:selenocysteine-specific translation elongation factor [Vicinamibacteria bacterium]